VVLAVTRELRGRVAAAALKEVSITSTRSRPATAVMDAAWQERLTRAQDTGSFFSQG
jgi:hypothetical protein